MLKVLTDLSEQTESIYIHKTLRFHAEMIMRAAEQEIKERNDLEDVGRMFATLLSANIRRSSV